MKSAKDQNRRLGKRLVEEFASFRDMLRAKKPLRTRYTVKDVRADARMVELRARALRVPRTVATRKAK